MSLGTVTLQIEPELARAYRTSPKETKSKLQLLLSLWLREYSARPFSLTEFMDELSEKAMARGLTEEKLDELLSE